MPSLEREGAVSELRLYVHPTCYSSYTLLKYLASKGLMGSTRLVSLTEPWEAVSSGIVSVPWLSLNGEPAAADPVRGEEVEAIIRGANISPPRDPLKAYMDSVLASSYASSLALLHGSLEPAAFTSLAKAALRYPLTRLDPGPLLETVKSEGRSLYESFEARIARVVAVSYVRELYWASGGLLRPGDLRVDRLSVAAWLMAKASVGRAGLPSNPVRANWDGIEVVVGIVEGRGDSILEDVRREQATIYGDLEYLKLLGL